MNTSTLLGRPLAAAAVLLCAFVAGAQFPQLVTEFEDDSMGAAYPFQQGSLTDLQVVFFQDPAQAVVTETAVLSDGAATVPLDPDNLPSSEESFVGNFTGDGFSGSNGSDQFLDIRFEWATTDADRWVLIETLQSPALGDPSLHLGGKVRFYINIPDCSAYEFPMLSRTPEIGVALLISETGRALPQGFQDDDVLNGSFEFVGVDSVIAPDTANPIPVPTTFIPITDPNCTGSTTGPSGDWRLVEFDLATANVVGWDFRGGDGVLDATGVGDGVNRGVLAGLVLTVQSGDITSQYVEFLIDEITFEAIETEPAVAPVIVGPVIFNDTTVWIDDITPRATQVILEIDRDPDDDPDVFTISETVSEAPELSTTGELRSMSIAVTALEIGDRLRVRQQVGADISDNSLIVTVNPPAAFSATLSLDEDGNSSTADYEWVGATSVVGQSGTQGKPIIPRNGIWQRLEYSLVPGVEPVIPFAGGNGQLQPDGGLYKLDSMFFTIDSSEPSTGPYDIFIDHVYYIDQSGAEVLISDAESANPFPNRRGQSSSINWTSILSGLASYDGTLSNRLGWEFPDTAGSNTHAPYRPPVTFPDSAVAVGMFLLVEDPRNPDLPTPTVETQIIGAAPAINVSGIDPTASQVDLLVDGEVVNSVDPAGAVALNIDPLIALELGESISAQMTVDGNPSNLAYARVVQAPGPPAVQGPLVEAQTAVTVTGILNTGNAVANQVTLFSDGTPIDSVDPAGQASVTFTVDGLVAGEQISASQTVNGIESVNSAPVGVGTGEVICVFINEVVYDDSGTDDREFVEIYNGEPDPVDISGWTLRASDETAPPLDDNPDYTIPEATVLAAGDYYVVGAGTVANVDLVVGVNNLWETANEAIELLNENGVVVDTFICELNKGAIAVSPAEGGFFGNFTSIDGTEQSISRWLDGYDTDDNGRDFGLLPITPGETNDIVSLDPLTENFSGGAGSEVPNFIGSFVNLTHINPAVVDAFNPSVIPASSQGGNAAVCWDPSGGGNQSALIDEARYNVAFSCEVYIDASGAAFDPENEVTNENENWSIGLGTVATFHNSLTGNGNTGLMWEFFIEEEPEVGGVGVLQMRLLDRNNGGTDGTVLLDVPAVAITTGWHTLDLTRNYEEFSASFDGTYSTSGTLPANGPSTVQMGYREYISTNILARPLTIDALVVTEPVPPMLGACCIDCGCTLLTEATCAAIGASYAGDDTDCTDADMNGVADACEALASPPPVLAAPICDGDVIVEVSGIVPEAAEVTIYAAGVNPIATAIPAGAETVRVFISPPLATDEQISATQTVGAYESLLSNEVTVIECPNASCLETFFDDFDADSSGDWSVVTTSEDSEYQFAYDYSADGIPPAPNGGGTTSGLKMEANLAAGVAGYVIASPIGVAPTGDYIVEVDYWINYDLAGDNSTEFIGGGVGHDGVTAERDGALFIVTGDGGSGSDYRLYKDGDLQSIADPQEGPQYTIASLNNSDPTISATFPGQTPPAAQGQTGTAPDGTQAFAWHRLTITVDSFYETVNVRIDGFNIGTLACGGELADTCDVGGALQLFYGDVFSSVAGTPSLQFGIFDNFVVFETQSGAITLFDWNADTVVDALDAWGIYGCLGGPDNNLSQEDCGAPCLDAFDVDSDNDVDLADIADFQAAL